MIFNPIDKTNPESIIDLENVISTELGYTSTNSFITNPGIDPIDAISAFTAKLQNGSTRVFASTVDHVFELIDNEWIERYEHSSSVASCSFTVLGNVVIMSNNEDKICVALESNSFNEIVDAPVAKVVIESGGFLLALDYVSGSNDYSDGWWSSGLYDYTTWIPATDNIAANGRLLQSPGKILAGISWNDSVIVFKATSVYLGRFVDNDVKWQWEVLKRDVGCIDMNSVTSTPVGIFWIDTTGLYRWDGNSIENISQIMLSYMQSLMNQSVINTQVVYSDDTVYFGFNSKSSTKIDNILVFNLKTLKFGRIKLLTGVNILFNYSPNTLTIDNNPYSFTSAITFAEIESSKQTNLIATIGIDSGLSTMTGKPMQSTMTFYIMGDDEVYSRLSQIIPRFVQKPESVTLNHYASDTYHDQFNHVGSTQLFMNKFNVNKRNRWHYVKLICTGSFTLDSLKYAISSKATR